MQQGSAPDPRHAACKPVTGAAAHSKLMMDLHDASHNRAICKISSKPLPLRVSHVARHVQEQHFRLWVPKRCEVAGCNVRNGLKMCQGCKCVMYCSSAHQREGASPCCPNVLVLADRTGLRLCGSEYITSKHEPACLHLMTAEVQGKLSRPEWMQVGRALCRHCPSVGMCCAPAMVIAASRVISPSAETLGSFCRLGEAQGRVQAPAPARLLGPHLRCARKRDDLRRRRDQRLPAQQRTAPPPTAAQSAVTRGPWRACRAAGRCSAAGAPPASTPQTAASAPRATSATRCAASTTCF